NDDLTEEQIVSTLRDLASQNVRQAFVHPRPGLMTPYLSEDWFRLWKKALETAEDLDMNIWIYDENSYPSGFAGGYVPEAMPESRGQGLTMESASVAPAWSDDLLAVYQIAGDIATNVSESIRSGTAPAEGEYLIVRIELAKASPWFGGWWYVDLLRPGVTEKFLEITFGAYEREIGAAFGKRMPGIFTDEPHLRPAGQYHWTPDLPAVFQQRWGYSLMDHLPSLAQPVGDWRRVRHNYYQTLLDLFVERWAQPCYEYCAEKGLDFTGHYWEHGWPEATTAPDNMAMYAWHQRPAIDTLFNQYSEGVHAQFGNTRAVLELSSVANQLGKERTLCEAYGGA
ncbi:MAG: glycosyl hydrolase, partial [Legionella sp.]|nr:glycosyl hydrolase [Legionella sp.]